VDVFLTLLARPKAAVLDSTEGRAGISKLGIFTVEIRNRECTFRGPLDLVQQFRLRVRDNGKGIEPMILDESGLAGHYGLPGMQERARLAGGKLTVSSRPDSGTDAELIIPASFAYAKSPGLRRSMGSGTGI
jgi:signal transduction histidine kinase